MNLGGDHIEEILEDVLKGMGEGDEYDRNIAYTYMIFSKD